MQTYRLALVSRWDVGRRFGDRERRFRWDHGVARPTIPGPSSSQARGGRGNDRTRSAGARRNRGYVANVNWPKSLCEGRRNHHTGTHRSGPHPTTERRSRYGPGHPGSAHPVGPTDAVPARQSMPPRPSGVPPAGHSEGQAWTCTIHSTRRWNRSGWGPARPPEPRSFVLDPTLVDRSTSILVPSGPRGAAASDGPGEPPHSSGSSPTRSGPDWPPTSGAAGRPV
ncbi:MAG: hypothetical protein ACI9YT_000548 [Halobacteriales archaeon]